MYDRRITEFIKTNYANTKNDVIARKLGISIYQVRRIASSLGVKKSKKFLEAVMIQTRVAQKNYFLNRIPNYFPTIEQWQIIFGSLLGDATLSKGPRSQNYAYKEHFGNQQMEYRRWKQNKLKNLGFHITQSNHLYSYSHPIFTKLYSYFFKNSIKVIPINLLSLMTHPIFLATLYMDDGSLLLSPRETSKRIYIHPSIAIYSQSFTKNENIYIGNHLNQTFGTNFVLNKRPDGHGYILKLNKEKEVRFFLQLISNYTKEIPSMYYKTNLQYRFQLETVKWSKVSKTKEILLSSSNRNKPYSNEEIKKLAAFRNDGLTWNEIADELNRSYWSILYKAKETGILGKKKAP